MIDVSHNADYRRTLLHLGFVLFLLLEQLCNDINLLLKLYKDVILKSDLLSLFVCDILILRNNLALHKQLFDDTGSRHLHPVCKLLYSEHLRNLDAVYIILRLLLNLFRTYKCSRAVRILLCPCTPDLVL